MNIEELIVRLRIEENNKSSEKNGFNPPMAKANVVEHDQNFKTSKNKFGKGPKMGPKRGVSKKKFFEKCYNYDRVGRRSLECRLPERNNKKIANMVDDITHDVSEMNLAAVISEVNLVGLNTREW
ncbi:CCHC-type domain-containing protein [Abeliophyllum distichum]|uniref:CCHC-type domain-containing protein n=1 Tax=Abeliophyllum distichum TaxID=126358 RepID=A0ABD1UF44_9LAMI